MTMDEAGGLLEGVRVIDLTTVMAGPFGTHQLAEFGADIIKVESPDGDSLRSIGPMRSPGMGAIFLHANRNKRSIVIDLKNKEGLEVLHRLVKTADVFVSNIRSQALGRLGLDYDSLALINPGLIYAIANGFGDGGPYEGRPAYDDLIQGIAGIPALASRASGNGTPRYGPIALADRATGLSLSTAILAGLYHRARTGRGHSIEVPMFETLANMVLGDHLGGLSFEPQNGGTGYQRLLTEHRRPYQTSDGHVCAVVYTNAHWSAFFDLIGEPDLVKSDPRYSSIGERTKIIDEAYTLVATHLLKRTTAEWLDLLTKADIPAAPMHTPETLFVDPHLEAVEFFELVEHPTEGTLHHMRRPSQWDGQRGHQSGSAPTLGQHTRGVLAEVGYAEDEIAALLANAAVAEGPRTAAKTTTT